MMHGRLIPKSALDQASANMGSYEEAAAALGWDTFRGWLDYLPGGGLNIAYEAVDRHTVHGRGEAEALRWLGHNGERRSFSYADLKRETDRFAGMLSKLGLERGARVFSLLGRVPELHIAALGALLFVVFGLWIAAANAEQLIEPVRKTIAAIDPELPALAVRTLEDHYAVENEKYAPYRAFIHSEQTRFIADLRAIFYTEV